MLGSPVDCSISGRKPTRGCGWPRHADRHCRRHGEAGGRRQQQREATATEAVEKGPRGDGRARRQREHLQRSASLARGRAARSSSTISVTVIPRSPSPRSFFSARPSLVETAVGLIRARGRGVAVQLEHDPPRASTSRSRPLSVVSAAPAPGQPLGERLVDALGSAPSPCACGRASARNQSSAVVRAMPSSHVRAVPRRGSNRSQIRSAFSNVALARSSAATRSRVRYERYANTSSRCSSATWVKVVCGASASRGPGDRHRVHMVSTAPDFHPSQSRCRVRASDVFSSPCGRHASSPKAAHRRHTFSIAWHQGTGGCAWGWLYGWSRAGWRSSVAERGD